MPPPSTGFWQPKVIRRFIDHRESSTQIILVNTELGDGYLKAMGNPEGEHVLACEWVGTQLAQWFGLPTFQFGLIEVTLEDELPFFREEKGRAQPGPAFISRAEKGEPWGGKVRQMNQLVNPQDISRLVVFDTWIRNCDRYGPRPPAKPRVNYGNVFLSEDAPPGLLRLLAMDHSHTFVAGKDLVPMNLGDDKIHDSTVYGLFPEFQRFLRREVVEQTVHDLHRMNAATAANIVQTIPLQWDVSQAGREALVNFVMGRAFYVSTHIIQWLWPQGDLFSSDTGESQP